jgi:ribonuclease G
MNKELYVSTTPHETKVALVEDDQLAEIYFERENEYTLAGSIYKGRVTRVLPGMQSAFVDIGLERDAFLYVSDFLDLQDEDEDSEFSDVKVTGPSLANANGLIVPAAKPGADTDDEDDSDSEAQGEESSAASAEGDAANGEARDGAPRWRGRRRRRGRRGGRERQNGEGQNGEAGQPAAPASGAQPAGEEQEDSDAPAPPAPRRQLRGFEPRGLAEHGIARNLEDADAVAPESDDEDDFETETSEPAATSAAPTAGVLPGESISKYRGGEARAPRSDSNRSESRGESRNQDQPAADAESTSGDRGERGGRRDRNDRGRRGRRDRDGGRDRGPRESREPRSGSRDSASAGESYSRPQNYTPILLPGESISKYRGVEPVDVPSLLEPAAEPVVHQADVFTHHMAPAEPIEKPEPEVEHFHQEAQPAAQVEPEAKAEPKAEANPDEPRSSASYSGNSGLPSMTQRRDDVPVSDAEAGDTDETVEEFEEDDFEETAEEAPATHAEATHVEAPHADALHVEATHAAAAQPETEARPGRRSWRDRVSKIFGSSYNAAEPHTYEAAGESAIEPEDAIDAAAHAAAQHEPEAEADTTEDFESQPEVDSEAQSATQPEARSATQPEGRREGRPSRRSRSRQQPRSAEARSSEARPTEVRPDEGRFVIEGGAVEHEELDEEEAEMPALAEHVGRYHESDDDDSEGSQFGTAVRDTGEENELEDDEYDFGGEEFEESELLADGSTSAEVEDDDEDDDEESEAGEGTSETGAEGEAAPSGRREPRRGRTERPGRRDRGDRSRRGAPPRGRRGAPRQSRAVPLISDLLKEGQEILVQIAKEPIGKKGARITSHIALPGRFLVYMPTVNHIGVSRKINSDEERQRLKRIVSSERENGHGGFIVRTAAANIREEELRADIRFLKHLWNEIRTRAESGKSPALIYHDLNLVERILRDQVTSDFSQIWVDNEAEYERVVRFASRFQPNLVRRIKLYTKDTPLFEQFGISEEINKSLKSKVWLKSGGYIVINQTEALVAIDINTGKYVGKTARLEDTIVKTNIDAVKEIVRQVRLRDLGGIIIVDFIDMDERKNRQKVMAALEEAMKADRAPSKILQFNDFGLVAITRKRVKQSLERTLGTPCPYCDSTGFVKSVPTICNEIYVEMRKVRRHVQGKEVMLRVNPEVAKELKGGNGRWLTEMEELLGRPVLVKSDAQLHQEKFDMNY